MKYNRNLVMYMLGRFISYIGSGIQQIAIPLFILDITHSGVMMGLFSLLTIVPNIITSPFSGILGDREDRKKLMIISDYIRGIIISFLGFLAMIGKLDIYILFMSQIIISIMDSIFTSSSSALLPELLPEDKLMKAMSVRGGLDASSMIIGPILGGIIYGIFGIKIIFYLNGISFIISGICSMLIIYTTKINDKGKMTLKSFLNENREVIFFIKDKKELMQLFSFIMLINLLLAPFFDIVMPYVIKKGIGFSSQEYGYLMSAFTIGILCGNIILGLVIKKFEIKNTMKISLLMQVFLVFTLAIIVFPKTIIFLGSHFIVFIVIAINILFVGIFNAFINTPLNTNIQRMVPNEMRSRFFSILGMVCQGAVPLGSICYGLLLDKFHYYYIIMAIAIIASIITVIFVNVAVDEVYNPVTDC